jgi:hypothetical protein
VLTAQQNNIGTKLTQTGSQFQIVFPATFVGVVRVMFTCIGTFTVAPTLNTINVAGGCTRPNDIPWGSGFTNTSAVSSLSGLQQYFDLRLTTNYAAVSSSCTVIMNGTGTVSYTTMWITELNELGDTPGSPPQLVNSNNVIALLSDT